MKLSASPAVISRFKNRSYLDLPRVSRPTPWPQTIPRPTVSVNFLIDSGTKIQLWAGFRMADDWKRQEEYPMRYRQRRIMKEGFLRWDLNFKFLQLAWISAASRRKQGPRPSEDTVAAQIHERQWAFGDELSCVASYLVLNLRIVDFWELIHLKLFVSLESIFHLNLRFRLSLTKYRFLAAWLPV